MTRPVFRDVVPSSCATPKPGGRVSRGRTAKIVSGMIDSATEHLRKRHDNHRHPDYTCGHRARYDEAATGCQRISGAAIDRAVGELLVELMIHELLAWALDPASD